MVVVDSVGQEQPPPIGALTRFQNSSADCSARLVASRDVGNDNIDLSKRNTDYISPDDGVPVARDVPNACVMIPTEIAGVIGVSANGVLQ